MGDVPLVMLRAERRWSTTTPLGPYRQFCNTLLEELATIHATVAELHGRLASPKDTDSKEDESELVDLDETLSETEIKALSGVTPLYRTGGKVNSSRLDRRACRRYAVPAS